MKLFVGRGGVRGRYAANLESAQTHLPAQSGTAQLKYSKAPLVWLYAGVVVAVTLIVLIIYLLS